MDRDPPPLGLNDEDDDDLFRSAVASHSVIVGEVASDKRDESESGYDTVNKEDVAHEGQMAGSRSDTLDDLKSVGLGSPESKPLRTRDDEEEDLFRSARIEPEPEKIPTSIKSVLAEAPADSVIALDEEEDEDANPFQDAHLNPQLQLSGGSGASLTQQQQPAQVQYTSFSANGESAAVPASSASAAATLSTEAVSTTSRNGYDADERREAEASDEFIEISVSNPHKVGDGISSYMVFKVTTRTNITYFKRKEMSVNRRFSDFLGLHDKLSEKYLQNGRVIPPAPDKSVVGMTKIKMGKEATAAMAGGEENGTTVTAAATAPDEFLERRRSALERYLSRTAAHPSLRTDPDFREFLELDAELPKSSQTSAISGKSVIKFINKVGDRVANITIKMEETDEWFEERSQWVDQLDSQLRRLHSSAEMLYSLRRALAASTGQVARSLSSLASTEEHRGLGVALAALADVQDRVERVHGEEQAAADFFLLAEPIKDYVGLVAAVKDVFQERVKAWQQWQSATSALTRKREAKVKAELQLKHEKVAVLRNEMAELERQQEMAQENFEKISRSIKREVELFEARKAQDFRTSFVRYLESMLKAQEEIAAHWERYLPEAQKIESKHGIL